MIFQLHLYISFLQFLGWMHNKIRDTNIEPFKDFKIGIPTLLLLFFFFFYLYINCQIKTQNFPEHHLPTITSIGKTDTQNIESQADHFVAETSQL